VSLSIKLSLEVQYARAIQIQDTGYRDTEDTAGDTYWVLGKKERGI